MRRFKSKWGAEESDVVLDCVRGLGNLRRWRLTIISHHVSRDSTQPKIRLPRIGRIVLSVFRIRHMHYQFLFDNPAIVEHFHEAILRRSAAGTARMEVPSLLRSRASYSSPAMAAEAAGLVPRRSGRSVVSPQGVCRGIGATTFRGGALPIIHPWPNGSDLGSSCRTTLSRPKV